MFGCSFMNLVTMAFRAAYSAPWLAGGGGVYPIHITRFTWPFDPLPDPVLLPPEEHAASEHGQDHGDGYAESLHRAPHVRIRAAAVQGFGYPQHSAIRIAVLHRRNYLAPVHSARQGPFRTR